MGVDVDAGGSLATAALVAGVIESENSAAVKDAPQSVCANCATPLTGPFCHACGQRAHVHRSLLHLGEEFLHGILHFDAKAWRTLPLLVLRPGRLTRHYLDGQRTRFVSPLALFLFMMFFMFFVASFTTGKSAVKAKDSPDIRAALIEKMDKEKRALEQAQSALAAARSKGAGVSDALEAIDKLQLELAKDEKAIKLFDEANSMAAASKPGARPANGGDGGLEASSKFSVTTGNEAIDGAFKKAMDNPELTTYKLKGAAAKFTFLLVPISLPFLWLMFCLRRDVTMYDHAVFALYSLSFMALLFSTAFLLNFAGLSTMVVLMLFLLPPVHMFWHLRGTYTLSFGAALWRTGFLLLSATLVFILYLGLVLVLAVK